MKTILQNSASVIFSLFSAILLLACIEWLGAILHPFPADFAGTREEVMEQVANYPPLVLALIGGLGWAATMLIATWMATRFSTNRHPAFGAGIGLVLFGGAIFNMSMLPYPVWFWILNLVCLPLGIFLGVKLGLDSSERTGSSGLAS